MSRGSVNKVILMGNLGSEPEVRYMPNGDAVTSFSIATTEVWKDKSSQDKKEQTEWHRIVVYSRLAEIVGQYAKRGSQMYIEGKLRTRKWQDAQQIVRFTTEVVANEIHILSNRNIPAEEFAANGENEGVHHNHQMRNSWPNNNTSREETLTDTY